MHFAGASLVGESVTDPLKYYRSNVVGGLGLLAAIGIEPSGSRVVHYADGTRDVVPVAKADIAIDGVETATSILCGRAGSLVLVGATTLETLGLGVDPVHKKLVPIEAPMARLVCTPIDAGASRGYRRGRSPESQACDFSQAGSRHLSCLLTHGLQDTALGGAS